MSRPIDTDAVNKIKNVSFTGSDGLDYVETLAALNVLAAISSSVQLEHNPDDERKIADLHKLVNYLLSRLEQSEPCEEDEELDFVQEHKKLPIILEARTKGSWIEVGREEGALGIEYKRLRCPKCGWESSLPIPRNFCPECGLDMRGGEQNG